MPKAHADTRILPTLFAGTLGLMSGFFSLQAGAASPTTTDVVTEAQKLSVKSDKDSYLVVRDLRAATVMFIASRASEALFVTPGSYKPELDAKGAEYFLRDAAGRMGFVLSRDMSYTAEEMAAFETRAAAVTNNEALVKYTRTGLEQGSVEANFSSALKGAGAAYASLTGHEDKAKPENTIPPSQISTDWALAVMGMTSGLKLARIEAFAPVIVGGFSESDLKERMAELGKNTQLQSFLRSVAFTSSVGTPAP